MEIFSKWAMVARFLQTALFCRQMIHLVNAISTLVNLMVREIWIPSLPPNLLKENLEILTKLFPSRTDPMRFSLSFVTFKARAAPADPLFAFACIFLHMFITVSNKQTWIHYHYSMFWIGYLLFGYVNPICLLVYSSYLFVSYRDHHFSICDCLLH